MKVLFLTNIPSPYRVDFFNEIGKRVKLTVLYERKTADDRDDSWMSNKARNFKEIYLEGKKVGNDSSLCMSVINFLKDKSYDLIIVGGYSTPTGMISILYMKLKKIPFILNTDGGRIDINDSLIKRKLKSFFIHSAFAWLSTGKNTTEYLIYYGANKSRIYSYPFSSIKNNSLVREPIKYDIKNNIKNELGITEDKVIIMVGQFIYRKGIDILLNASRDLKDSIGVYIVGGEPTEEYLKIKERFNLKNVHFVSFISKERLNKYYLASDIFVFPTREDIWGLVINEAMANRLPVITTNKCVAGLELIKDCENGYLIESENHEDLIRKINILIKNKELREKIADNNIKRIEGYTIEKMAEKHYQIFEEIIKMKG